MKGAMCIHNTLVFITQNTFLRMLLKFNIFFFLLYPIPLPWNRGNTIEKWYLLKSLSD